LAERSVGEISSSAAVVTPAGGNTRWLVLALLTVGVIIAYTDRINLSSALPEIRRSFPLSPEAAGILLSAFFWSYTLLQTPAGWIVDRFGLKWPYAAGLFLWSAVSAATALVSSLNGLIAVRIALGIGESIVTPASMRYIRKNFAENERGLPIGIFMSGTKYGPAIGAPIATYLVLGYGWRWMFVLNGALCFLWLVPWFLFVRSESTPEKRAAEETVSWAALLGTPLMWGTCVATFCYMYFVYFCMTWMPTYFKDRFGLSLTASGWFTFMSFGGLATIAILSGWAADRLIARGRNPVMVRKAFKLCHSHSLPGCVFTERTRPGHGELLGPDPDVDACVGFRPGGGYTEHCGEPGGNRGAVDHRRSGAKDGKLQCPAGRYWLLALSRRRLLSVSGQGKIRIAIGRRTRRNHRKSKNMGKSI
jgi:ACS family D-galactonate transporter-like MFS transporter